MTERNILFTGGTDGIGKAAAHQLAKMGARLLLVGRNRDKGEAAVTEISRSSGNPAITFLEADLSLMREMQRSAQLVRQTFNRLDVLLHAAGGRFPRQRTQTDEGLELTFAVQYLARFVLTNELLDVLNAAPAPQVLSISGGASESRQVDFDNLQGEKSYGKFEAIGKSSATNYLLTLGQITRYPEITFYNYGPGVVRTATVAGDSSLVRLFFNTLGRLFTRSPQQAANDIVALIEGDYPSGFYRASLKPQEAPAEKSDAESSDKLWEYGQQLMDSWLSDHALASQTGDPVSLRVD